MLYKIVDRFPEDMIFKETGPLISLYQSTHRYFPDNKQDPIVFKNLLRDIENSLKQKVDSAFIDKIMKPLYEIRRDTDFWNNTLDGLAVMASENKCIVYKLRNPVKDFAVVSNSFHVKPLLQTFQSLENYQLLGLSRENFVLYQGNRYGFQEVEIDPDIPRTMTDVLGDQLSGSHLSHGTYAGAGVSAYHGHVDAKDEIDKDTEKYFRYVDSFVFENYSKQSKLPLILVSLKEHRAKLKSLSNNTYLLEEGINKSIDSLELDEIQKQASAIIETFDFDKMKILADSYAKAEADSLGSSDIAQVAKAAQEGRVKTILLEENKIIPGKICFSTGEIEPCDISSPDCGDILNDMADLVLLNRGDVFVLNSVKMPSTTGIAATYRYK
ncbi:MAG: hypothetical protein GX850_06530 [Clostridiaceae bacterium]|nr:hypothetical protein [Clostridiaceae bacterium]